MWFSRLGYVPRLHCLLLLDAFDFGGSFCEAHEFFAADAVWLEFARAREQLLQTYSCASIEKVGEVLVKRVLGRALRQLFF